MGKFNRVLTAPCPSRSTRLSNRGGTIDEFGVELRQFLVSTPGGKTRRLFRRGALLHFSATHIVQMVE